MARSFTDDGSSTTSYVSKSSTIITGSPATFSILLNVSSFSNGLVLFILGDGGNNNFQLFLDTSGHVTAASHSGAGSPSAVTTVAASLNTWTHAAGVFASSTSRSAYINGGNKITNVTSNSPSAFNQGKIGGDGNIGDGTHGILAFAGIWNIALSDTDIATLGAYIHPSKVHPEALVGCVDLIGVSPEPDRVSTTGWTLGGTGASAVATNPLIYSPASRIKLPPPRISFSNSASPKASNTQALKVSVVHGGTVNPLVSANTSMSIFRGFFQVQALKIAASATLGTSRFATFTPQEILFMYSGVDILNARYLQGQWWNSYPISSKLQSDLYTQVLNNGPVPDIGWVPTAF